MPILLTNIIYLLFKVSVKILSIKKENVSSIHEYYQTIVDLKHKEVDDIVGQLGGIRANSCKKPVFVRDTVFFPTCLA